MNPNHIAYQVLCLFEGIGVLTALGSVASGNDNSIHGIDLNTVGQNQKTTRVSVITKIKGGVAGPAPAIATVVPTAAPSVGQTITPALTGQTITSPSTSFVQLPASQFVADDDINDYRGSLLGGPIGGILRPRLRTDIRTNVDANVGHVAGVVNVRPTASVNAATSLGGV